MLPQNLIYLRRKFQLSQQALAEAMGIPRTTLGEYERGNTEPNIELLIRLADHFKLKVDDLVRANISHHDLEILRSKDLRVLAISIDQQNRENIELVDTKAKAGYLEGFADPEYIRDLPKLYFPAIPAGTYRAFEIQGDSMLPIQEGNIVICKYVESLKEIKDNRTYVIVSNQEGIVYKRVKTTKEAQALLLVSDNELYPPYWSSYKDIAEVWQYYAHLSSADHKGIFDQLVEARLMDIQQKVTRIEQRLIQH